MELLEKPPTKIIIINNTILILIVDYQTRGSPILWVQTGRAPHVSRWTPSPLGQEHQGVIVRKELSWSELVRAPHVSR